MKIKLVTGMAITFALLSGYLTYRVFDLRKQLYRAEYFAQSGLWSAWRICYPVIQQLREAPVLRSELADLASDCVPPFDSDEVLEKEYERILRDSVHQPGLYARYLERRIKIERHLPHRSPEPVTPELMPIEYYNGTKIP